MLSVQSVATRAVTFHNSLLLIIHNQKLIISIYLTLWILNMCTWIYNYLIFTSLQWVERCYLSRQYGRTDVRPIVRACVTKCTILYREQTAGRRSANFIFKFKDLNRLRWEVHSAWIDYIEKFIVLVFHKWRQIEQTISKTKNRRWPFDWYIYIWSWPILKIKVKVLHTSTVNISQTVEMGRNITIVNRESSMWTFDWHNYIWPWHIIKVIVKVMHISTVNLAKYDR